MEIDRQLRDWAQRHLASPAHLEGLARKATVKAAHQRSLGVPIAEPALMLFWGKLGYALSGAIVAMVVLMLCVQHGGSRARETTALSVAQLAKPTPAQMTVSRRLFAETTRLFPKQLRWMAQSNGDMGLGVENEGAGSVADTPPMLVRMVVVSRTAGESAWRPVWTTDVILRGEELVEISPNRNSSNKLTMWVYPLQNGKVAVDSAVDLDKPLKLSSRLNSVVTEGVPAEVATVRMGDTEYRLFQTVETLCAEKEQKI